MIFLHKWLCCILVMLRLIGARLLNVDQSFDIDVIELESSGHLRSTVHTYFNRLGFAKFHGFEGFDQAREEYLKVLSKCFKQNNLSSINQSSQWFYNILPDKSTRMTGVSLGVLQDDKWTGIKSKSKCNEYDRALFTLSQSLHFALSRVLRVVDRRFYHANNLRSTVLLHETATGRHVINKRNHLDYAHIHIPKTLVTKTSLEKPIFELETTSGIVLGIISPATFVKGSIDGTMVPIMNPDDSLGMKVQDGYGKLVNVKIATNEILVFAGEGLADWSSNLTQYRIAPKKMNLPPTVSSSELIRVWFSKKILPPPTVFMKRINGTYGKYLNESLKNGIIMHKSPFMQKNLMASMQPCDINICHNKNDRFDVQKCYILCNIATEGVLNRECDQRCTCEAQYVDGGIKTGGRCIQLLPLTKCSYKHQRPAAHSFEMTCVDGDPVQLESSKTDKSQKPSVVKNVTEDENKKSSIKRFQPSSSSSIYNRTTSLMTNIISLSLIIFILI